ncbi:MAG: hypothetical protein AAB432_03235 [Patescibacteria group bacterium]
MTQEKGRIIEEFDNFMLEEYGKWKIGRAEVKEFIIKALASQKKEILKQVENLIIDEMTTANKENQPTSRLTSLINKLKE